MRIKRVLVRVLLGIAGLLVLIQLVPYGRDHDNPPVRKEPVWDSPRTRELAVRACFDCHSNQTRWPWYSHVAPISWLLQDHVEEGREHLDFSEWDRPQDDAHEAAEMVQKGEMPLPSYLLLHPEARLSDADEQALIRGLQATLGTEAGGAGEHGHGEGEHHEEHEDGEH